MNDVERKIHTEYLIKTRDRLRQATLLQDEVLKDYKPENKDEAHDKLLEKANNLVNSLSQRISATIAILGSN